MVAAVAQVPVAVAAEKKEAAKSMFSLSLSLSLSLFLTISPPVNVSQCVFVEPNGSHGPLQPCGTMFGRISRPQRSTLLRVVTLMRKGGITIFTRTCLRSSIPARVSAPRFAGGIQTPIVGASAATAGKPLVAEDILQGRWGAAGSESQAGREVEEDEEEEAVKAAETTTTPMRSS